MKIRPSAQAQVPPANSGATGNQDQPAGGGFDDALAGVGGGNTGSGNTDGGNPGNASITAGADPTTGKPAPAGMSLSASRLAELAAIAANANGVSARTSGLAAMLSQAAKATQAAQTNAAAPDDTANAPGVSQAMLSSAADAVRTALAAVSKGAVAPPDPAAKTTFEASADPTATAAALVSAASPILDGVLAASAPARGADAADPAAPDAASAAGAASPSVDLLAFLASAVMRGSAAGTSSTAATNAATTTPAASPAPSVGTPSQADTAVATPAIGGAEDPSDAGKVLLSDITIESHIAPAAAKTLGAAGDGKAASTAVPASTAIVDAGAMAPPVRAIADSVVSLASQTASSAVAVPDDVTAAVPAAARTMTLQLSPAHLGTVSVRLHVTGQTLDVELSLSDQQTLGLVSRERDVLASALRDQNYDLHTLVIQGADGSAGASGDQNLPGRGAGPGGGSGGEATFGGGRSSAGHGAGNGAGNGGGNGGGAGQQASTGSSRRSNGDDSGAADRGARRGVDALFV